MSWASWQAYRLHIRDVRDRPNPAEGAALADDWQLLTVNDLGMFTFY